jgi:hypothetical protein
MGELYLRQLWIYLVTVGPESNLEFWWKKQKELTKTGLDAAALTWDPVLAFATYSGLSRMLRGPIVQADTAAEDAPLNPNYIKLLLDTTDLQTMRQEMPRPARADCRTGAEAARARAYWKSAFWLRFRPPRTGVLRSNSKLLPATNTTA